MAVGIPKDREHDKISMFLPKSERTVLIIDQFDMILEHHSEAECVEVLNEVEFPVLLLVSSWERTLELKKQGCQMLCQEKPGFGRWTEEELSNLFKTYRNEVQVRVLAETTQETPVQLATLAGSPGILFEECFGDKEIIERRRRRAELIDAEWRNGIRALCGTEEIPPVITGRFPDKNGEFHWD